MRQILAKLLPDNDRSRKWFAIGITALLSGLLTLWGIYGIGQYGIALFILTPVFMGIGSAVLYGLKKGITQKEAFQVGMITLIIFTAGLIIFAIEGFICIMMAAPIGFFLTWAGTVIGHAIVSKTPDNAATTMLLLMGIIPTTGFIEKTQTPTLTSVVSSIEINAGPETVWKNVIEFPQLDEPTEFIFKTGIAYPINAKIEGSGVGAIRHCNFTTGSFVEPIIVWDQPQLLKFDVAQQPAPMKELSFWDLDAPHLHDYFVSKQGQFKLTKLPNGHTLLEGTTWYYDNIRPEFYWHLWSNAIIHKIHERVLKHIKKNAEGGQKVKLSCLIKADNIVYKKGNVPNVTVEIKNNSDSTIQLVKSLDGSSSRIRFPYAYFKIEMLYDTSYKISTYRDCGNYDGIDSTDFVEVKPGETFDPYKYQTLINSDYSIKDPRNFEKKGKYKITFYYSTNEFFFLKWMGDRYAGQTRHWIDWKTGKPVPEKEAEYNHLIALFKSVPKTELVSNELIIEIK